MALALGQPDPDVMLSKMSLKTFNEWIAYFVLEPFGEERADVRSAIVASVIANANRGKRSRPFKIEDFMPKFGPTKPQTADEAKSVLMAISAGMKMAGEKIKRGK